MEIRKINLNEKLNADMISALAFVQKRDFTERLTAASRGEDVSPEDADGYDNIWGAFNDSGVMTARITFYPFEVMFDGHKVKMSGVGDVAALPEHRSGGAAKAIMERACRRMYDSSVVFSYLYPFSHKYYRKLGYELAFERRVATIPSYALTAPEQKDSSLEFFTKGADLSPYMDVYKAFISRFNLAIVRTEAAFGKMLNKDPYSERQYTYLWKDEKNSPQAYVVFRPEQITLDVNDGFCMHIIEFAYSTPAGFNGMFAALKRFAPQYKHLRWEVPSDIDPFMLTDEPYDISLTSEKGGMNRIINVPVALSLMRAPGGAGEVTISVSDAFLPQNTGAYKISWDKGRLTCAKTDKPADAAVPVTALAQLVCGYITPDTLARTGHIEVLKNNENLNKLFFKKVTYITDRF